MRSWLSLSLVVFCAPWLVQADALPDATTQLQQAFPKVQLYTEGGRLTRVWGTPVSFGDSPELSAFQFVQDYAGLYGITADDLLPGNGFNDQLTQPAMYDAETGTYKFTLVYYRQYRDGLPVYNADLRLLVRNEPDHPLVLVASSVRNVGDFRVAPNDIVRTSESAAFAAAQAFEPALRQFSTPELVIWAGVDNLQAAPQLALAFVAEGVARNSEPKKYRLVCDATSGEILHRQDLIIFTDVTGTVQGMATTGPKSAECNAEALGPMKYARVTITGGNTAYTDANGNFTILNAGSTPVTVQSFMAGTYFTVDNVAGTEETLTLNNVVPPGPADFNHNAANTNAQIRSQVNGYVQANVVRDWIVTQNPSYPTISTQTNFPVNVNRSDGYCPGNAWYDGSSINFCNASGSYPNTAYSSVIHHEYGHHLVEMGGSGQDQYGEGMGDCTSVLILDDPILGWGFFGDCLSGLRTAENTMQYPCSDEAHACAPLLSGCVWDTRQELAVTEPILGLAILSNLTVNSVLLHNGSTITPQITIDFLTLDDDNGDIADGTPHYAEIDTGFGNHNMPAPELQLLAFSFPNGRPSLVSPAGGDTVQVQVSALTDEPQPGTGMFYYRAGGGGGYTSVAMTEISANLYEVAFPAATCGTVISYYFSAQTTTATTVYNPSDAPGTVYQTLSAYGLTVAVNDKLETETGWTVGDTGDTATTGVWTRNNPEPTPAQPGDDHTPGIATLCWVTDYRAGSGIGDYDVDGGKTTVKTPIYDLSAFGQRVSYWRWYSNDQGSSPNADTFRVSISNNGGSTWVLAETVGPTGPETGGGWYYHEFFVTSFVPMSSQIRLRFVAEDAGSGSIIEAAVDDFKIEGVDCTPPAFDVGDMNCDGVVDFGDINPFVLYLSDLAVWQATFAGCPTIVGDINGDDAYPSFADINPFIALLSGP